jgi:2,4-dichlorophenol 6-monooxygenase
MAAVEAGWAQPALLDSYESERRPVAQKNADNSLSNAMKMFEVAQALGLDQERTNERMRATLADPEGRARVEAAIANQAEHFDTLGLQLGFRYDAGAIVPDGTAPPEIASPVREFVQSGRPGARMPHAWLIHGGKRCSTLDLLSLDSFTLITTSPNEAWETAVADISAVPVRYVAIERDSIEDEGCWLKDSGIGLEGALLVRPDQHVAWRAASLPPDPSSVLCQVIAQIAEGRSSKNANHEKG